MMLKRGLAAFVFSLVATPALAADYILAVEPNYPPAQAEQVYKPLLDYLSKSTGHTFRLKAATNYHVYWRDLRSGSKTSFLIALSQLADIDFHTAQQIIERKELDALSVVCRAADLDRALFLTYAVVLLNDDGDAMGKAHGYARMYSELSRDAAQRTAARAMARESFAGISRWKS